MNKILRSIDAAELLSGGTLIDSANRAEKRGIIDSVEEIRELKDLRNDIAHEYETKDLRELFSDVLNASSKIFTISNRIADYCKNII